MTFRTPVRERMSRWRASAFAPALSFSLGWREPVRSCERMLEREGAFLALGLISGDDDVRAAAPGQHAATPCQLQSRRDHSDSNCPRSSEGTPRGSYEVLPYRSAPAGSDVRLSRHYCFAAAHRRGLRRTREMSRRQD